MNKVYGFEGECKAKLGEMTYKLFGDVFTMRKSESSCPSPAQLYWRVQYFNDKLFSKPRVILDEPS